MRSRSLIILAVVTFLAVVLAAFVVYQREAGRQLAATPEALFPGLVDKVNEVAKVEVVTPEERFSIERVEGEKWVAPEKGGYPARFEAVKQAVVGMASLRPIEPRTAAEDRYGRLKVKMPTPEGDSSGEGALLRLLDARGEPVAEIIVGKTKSVPTTGREGWYYVRRPDEPRSWLAEGRIEVFQKTTSWLDPTMPTVSRKRIRQVVAIDEDGNRVVVERELPSTSDFAIANVPEGRKPKHSGAGNALGSSLGFLSYDDVGKAEAVDFSGGRKVEFHTFDGLVVEVEMAEHDGGWWARYGARADDGVSPEDLPEAERAELKPAEEVAEEVKGINEFFGPWAYRLPDYKAKDFATDMDQVTEPKAASDS